MYNENCCFVIDTESSALSIRYFFDFFLFLFDYVAIYILTRDVFYGVVKYSFDGHKKLILICHTYTIYVTNFCIWCNKKDLKTNLLGLRIN